jgi:hypothetical protein
LTLLFLREAPQLPQNAADSSESAVHLPQVTIRLGGAAIALQVQ